MGRPTGPREDSGDGCPFLRRSPPRPGPLPEDRSYFEEPDITVPVGPVVLDAPHRTLQQAPSQVRLFGGHGIEDRHGVGTVGRPERQRARLEHNWANRNRDIRLFEVGTVFRKGTGAPGAPEEWTSVAGVLTGARRPPHWSEGAKLPDMDIWDLKYHFELAVAVASPSCDVRPTTGGAVGWEAVQRGGGVVGWAGPLEADAPVWAAPLFGFEVRLDAGERDLVAYRPLPLQPPVERDLALVLPPGVTAAQVSDALRRTVGPLLERLEVFDED